MMRRAVTAAALAAALLLTVPAAAAGPGWDGGAPGLFARAWQWIAGWLAPDAGPRPAGGSLPGGWTHAAGQDGIHIDPNGRDGAATPCTGDGCVRPLD
jgi:hypothetical protein